MPFPKKAHTYQVVQPIASPLTHPDDEETLMRSRFARDKNFDGKCLGLERQACVATMREVCRLSRLGRKRNGVVRKWYARFLMMLKATVLAAYRISRANPSWVQH